MAPFLRRAPLFATAALLLSAPALAQEPAGSGGTQDGSWFPAEKKEAPRPAPDEIKPDEPDEKPAPKPAPRPASAPLPPPNQATPAPYRADGPATSGRSGPGRSKRPKGNVSVYLGGSGVGGNLDSENSMRSVVEGAVVLGADLQFNVSRHVTFGGYLDAGAVGRQAPCFGGETECNDGLFRLGLSARYHLRPGRGVDPWLGVGAGLSALSFSDTLDDGSKLTTTYVGFDLLNLQAGVDFALGRVFSLGPYVGFNNGVYTGAVTETEGAAYGRSRDTDRIGSSTLHTWTTLGIRGRFNFF